MGLKLFTFAYNTLLKNAVEQSSKLFLPKVLAAMKSNGGAYLPISVPSWSVDSLPDTYSQAFAITWFTPYFQNTLKLSKQKPDPPKITQKMIDDAKQVIDAIKSKHLTVISCPDVGPAMTIESMEIQGLANVRPLGSVPTPEIGNNGYQCRITLDFNAYPYVKTDNWNRPLALSGSKQGTDANTEKKFTGLGFKTTQCLCFAKKSAQTTCVPKPAGVVEPSNPGNKYGFTNTASGQASINIENVQIVADVNISVATGGKTLAVTVNRLTFEAESGDLPTYKLMNIGIDHTPDTEAYVGPWAKFVTNMLGTPETAKSFSNQVTKALNSPDNKTKLESTLNTQLNDALNSLLGTPSSVFASSGESSTGEPNQVDQFIFDRTGDALNNPKSDLYLPEVVHGVTSPVLEPYTAANLDVSGNFSTDFIGTKLTISQIKLPSLKVTGLSNLIAPSGNVKFGGEVADATFELGRITSFRTVPPPPLTAVSTFSMMAQVGTNNPLGPFTGRISVKVEPKTAPTTPAVKTSLGASGDKPEALVLTLSGLSSDIAPEEIDIQIKLDGEGAPYSNPVTEIAGQSSLKQSIISAINSKIKDDLPEISKYITTFAKQQINNI